jgi:hypothetical protein
MMPSAMHNPTTRGCTTTRGGVTVEYEDHAPEWKPQPTRKRKVLTSDIADTAVEAALNLARKELSGHGDRTNDPLVALGTVGKKIGEYVTDRVPVGHKKPEGKK